MNKERNKLDCSLCAGTAAHLFALARPLPLLFLFRALCIDWGFPAGVQINLAFVPRSLTGEHIGVIVGGRFSVEHTAVHDICALLYSVSR